MERPGIFERYPFHSGSRKHSISGLKGVELGTAACLEQSISQERRRSTRNLLDCLPTAYRVIVHAIKTVTRAILRKKCRATAVSPPCRARQSRTDSLDD